jgi:hypothetical protein
MTESTTIVGGFDPASIPEHGALSVGGAAFPEKGIAVNITIRKMQKVRMAKIPLSVIH